MVVVMAPRVAVRGGYALRAAKAAQIVLFARMHGMQVLARPAVVREHEQVRASANVALVVALAERAGASVRQLKILVAVPLVLPVAAEKLAQVVVSARMKLAAVAAAQEFEATGQFHAPQPALADSSRRCALPGVIPRVWRRVPQVA